MKNKPWFRDFDGWWYVTVSLDGKRQQIKLARGRDKEDEAYSAYHRVMLDLGQATTRSDITLAEICDLFLDASQRENDPKTYAWYKRFLEKFCGFFRGEVADLKPLHVNRWLARHNWSQSTRRQAITCIKRALNWAIAEGHLADNPLRTLKKPPMERRQKIITAAEHQSIEERSDAAFRTFLRALRDTGARPGEVRTVTAAMVDLKAGVWIFKKHKTVKKTQKPRIVYLTPTMIELTRELMEKHPEGPLFRNRFGKP